MSTTTTLKTLIQDVAQKLWEGQDPIVLTATGGSVTTIAASSYAFTDAPTTKYSGVYVYVATTTDGLAPQGEIRQVRSAGFVGSTGTWTVSPAFSAAVESGDIIIFLYGLHRSDYVQCLNRGVTNCYVEAWLPLTLIADGDMESSGVASWSAVGTPTTRAKTATAANVLLGKRALSLASDATDEGATSVAVPVTAGEQLIFSAPISCPTGSVRAQLWDATNSAEIYGATVSQEAWTEVRFQAGVPATCKNVTIRFISKTASSTWYVGWAGLLSQERDYYRVPSTMGETNFIEEVLALPQGYPSTVGDSYIIFSEERLFPWPHGEPIKDYQGANSFTLSVATPSAYPLFVKFRRPETALSADSDTTSLPAEAVERTALHHLFKILAGRPGRMAPYYAVQSNFYKADADALLRDFGPGQGPRVRQYPQRRVALP